MPSNSNYHITEPHPSLPASNYIHSGRGGAGNVAHVDPKKVTRGPDACGPASLRPLKAPSASSYYTAGRGGAGNIHHNLERPMFSFDEELERQRKMMEHQAPIYHIGRGGAGNLVGDQAYSHQMSGRPSDASSTTSSQGRSTRQSFEGAWNRVRGSFSK